MNPPPRFLSVDDVLTLHAIAIENQGGDPSLRDRALLESAVATPAQRIGGEFAHEDIPAMAAAYAFHICKNHPFVDGNKRAATAAMIAFLSDNGWAFDATADEAEPVMLQLAASELDKAAFANWAREHMREKPKMELREFFASLSAERLFQILDSINASNPSEAHTTFREVFPSLPVTKELLDHTLRAQDAGNEQEVLIYGMCASVFIAVYRIAEDMGYEW